MSAALRVVFALAFGILASVRAPAADEPRFEKLFPEDGPVTKGWFAPAPLGRRQGRAQGGDDLGSPRRDPPRRQVSTGQWVGTWLFSEREYGNFILEVDFKFQNGGATGNGGLAVRSPLQGRPSFDGFELQITDPRYEFSLYPEGTSDQLTGAIYKAMAPRKQVYNPGEWNRYRVELRGPQMKVWVNEVLVHDLDLDAVNTAIKRPEGGDLRTAAVQRPTSRAHRVPGPEQDRRAATLPKRADRRPGRAALVPAGSARRVAIPSRRPGSRAS